MGLISARAAHLDADSVEVTGTDNFGVKLVPAGDIQKAAASAGLELKPTLAGAYTFTSLPQSAAVPANANDFVTKSYADGAIAGLAWKDNVRALSDANVPLTGAIAVDGVVFSGGDSGRILLTGQTNPAENGIWEVNTGAWTRPIDYPAAGDATSAVVAVDQGTTYADTIYRQTGDGVVIDTGGQTWVDLPVVAKVAGAGIADVANTFNIVATDNSLTINADDMQVKLSATGAVLETAADGVRIAAAAAGNGLTGGAAAALSVDVAALIEGGSVPINADLLEISHPFTNIVPNSGNAEVTSATQLGSILAGVDDALSNAGYQVQSVTLSAAQATANAVVALTNAVGDITQSYVSWTAGSEFIGGGGDIVFTAGAAGAGSVSWAGGVLNGVLAAGDEILVFTK